MSNKVLTVIDALLTPLVDIAPAKVRKAIYAFLPVVVTVLGVLAGASVLSGQVAVWVGGIYSGLSGLLAAANTVTVSKAK